MTDLRPGQVVMVDTLFGYYGGTISKVTEEKIEFFEVESACFGEINRYCVVGINENYNALK